MVCTLMPSTPAHKEKRRSADNETHLKIKTLREAHWATVPALGERLKCLWLSTNGHLTVPAETVSREHHTSCLIHEQGVTCDSKIRIFFWVSISDRQFQLFVKIKPDFIHKMGISGLIHQVLPSWEINYTHLQDLEGANKSTYEKNFIQTPWIQVTALSRGLIFDKHRSDVLLQTSPKILKHPSHPIFSTNMCI